MPRIPRKLVVDPKEVGVYHCMNRCVRRAMLCGIDPLTGKCFDHRKQWIQKRLEFLAGLFAVDVMGFAVMSNHVHAILRNRPDVVDGWTDEEVVRRWEGLFPSHPRGGGERAEATASQAPRILPDPQRLEELRARLSSLSWFMGSLAERIARDANAEDECKGRFWEGRFKSVPILDEPALVACLAYVDLNPIRAHLATTPQTSRFTSVFERINALLEQAEEEPSRDCVCVSLHGGNSTAATVDVESPAVTLTEVDGNSADQGQSSELPGCAWLSPFEVTDALLEVPSPSARASNTGCLPMRFADYLVLLDWTARQLQGKEPDAVSVHGSEPGPDPTQAIMPTAGPAKPPPILARLGVTCEAWLRLASQFSRLFRRAAGRPESLRRHSDKWGRRRTPGISHSRALFTWTTVELN